MDNTLATILIIVVLAAFMGATMIYFNMRMQSMRKDYESQTTEKQREAEQRQEMERQEMERRLALQQKEMEQRIKEQSAQNQEQSRLHFSNLAEEILKKQSAALKTENTELIANALNPVKTKLEEFSKTITDSYVKETADRKSLSDQIERLMQLNSDIGKEARNLTTALKGDSKIQGDWGEMVLETLLENAGMVKGKNYFTQVTRDDADQTIKDESGKQLRPDVVVALPDNHKMVIDSKVSLTAYSDYMSASTDDEKKEIGKRHIRSVKSHINELGDKKYQKYIKDSADHVLMFIPNEGAYYLAMQLEPDLWKYAYDQKVVMVSPTHLFSVMQIVAQLWQQDRQNKYAMEIAKAGGELYDKFVDYYNDMTKVEKSLNDVVKNFEKCHKDVENRVGLTAKANKLKELGAKATKNLPE